MGEKKPPAAGGKKPWMKKRPGETVRQWNTRTNHTCYACGVYIADTAALDAHEATHR